MFDLLIKNGRIADGTGGDAYAADIGIRDGVIDKLGRLNDAPAGVVIDAGGKLVTPGFIDMHSHADLTALIFPKMECSLMQGITTVVAGQCGYSLAPAEGYWAIFFDDKVVDEIEPYVYEPQAAYPMDRAREPLKKGYGLDVSWKTFGEYLERVEKTGMAANFIPLVGHGQIRLQVMGGDHRRSAGEDEIQRMKKSLEEAMEAGAYGLSAGLDYAPGIYAGFDELAGVSGVLKKYGGIYTAHWRRTGLRSGTPKPQKKIDGIIETLEIGRQCDIQVQISHLFPGFDVYPGKNSHMIKASAEATLQVIDGYIEKGVNAGFDVIPDTMDIQLPLCGVFGPWIKQSGSVDQFIRNLKAGDYRAGLAEVINTGRFYAINPVRRPDWDSFMTVIGPADTGCLNKTVKEIADLTGKASVEVIFDMLTADPAAKISYSQYDLTAESVMEFLRHPLATVGTDALTYDLAGKNGLLPPPNALYEMIQYLKTFGMPRIEDTIRKATGKTAEVLGLRDRGLIKEGYKADILVIDMEHLETNENVIPRVFPEGMDYVVVNGIVAVERGRLVGALAGRVLRKTGA